MERKKLIKAFRQASSTYGYVLQTGHEYRVVPELKVLPAIWLLPLEVTKVVGVREGIKYYKAEFKILFPGNKSNEEAKESLWAEMESVASKIILSLCADESIKTVTDIKYKPAEFSVTNKADLSLTITCSIQVPFCK